ncbi:MAG: TfoX/Sxy family protein [Pseudohongiellaceae bacterium]
MAISKQEREFAAYLVDLLQGMGLVYSKSMFGGFGLFLDGLMFGLVADSELYLKVDSENLSEFEELGLQPFTYNKQGKPMNLSYYQAPEESMEDNQLLVIWGNSGFGAALRAASKKSKKK